jgi:flagellar hook-basal body complex protein FliE
MNGETEEIHKVALDQQKAAISLDLFLQVRNKVINAYQEIMKMQV